MLCFCLNCTYPKLATRYLFYTKLATRYLLKYFENSFPNCESDVHFSVDTSLTGVFFNGFGQTLKAKTKSFDLDFSKALAFS